MHSTLEKYNSLMLLSVNLQKKHRADGKVSGPMISTMTEVTIICFPQDDEHLSGENIPGGRPCVGLPICDFINTPTLLPNNALMLKRPPETTEKLSKNTTKIVTYTKIQSRADSKQLLSIRLYAALSFLYT